MDIQVRLQNVYTALNQVVVGGHHNTNCMASSMTELFNIINELEAKKKEPQDKKK